MQTLRSGVPSLVDVCGLGGRRSRLVPAFLFFLLAVTISAGSVYGQTYTVGSRVAAAVDYPAGNPSLYAGDQGTVRCLFTSGGFDLLVQWDKTISGGHTGFANCTGATTQGHGWAVMRSQVRLAGTSTPPPAPTPRICTPGAVQSQSCSAAAGCSGTQNNTCNATGTAWSGWSACAPPPSGCAIRSATATSTSGNQTAYFFGCARDPSGVRGLCFPFPYTWTAYVRADYSYRGNDTANVTITRIDESLLVHSAGLPNQPCNVVAGINTTIYDGYGRSFGAFAPTSTGAYLYSPSDRNFGGLAFPNTQVYRARLQPNAAVAAYDCTPLWSNSYSWSFNVP